MRCASQDDELTLLVGRWEGEPGVAHPLSPCGNAGHDDAVARHTVHRQRLQYDVVRVRGSGRAGPSGGAHAQKHHLGGLKGMEGDMRVPVAFRRGIHYLGGGWRGWRVTRVRCRMMLCWRREGRMPSSTS